jgi:hypothetical protein
MIRLELALWAPLAKEQYQLLEDRDNRGNLAVQPLKEEEQFVSTKVKFDQWEETLPV